MQDQDTHELERLESLDHWQLHDENQDIRGRTLFTALGQPIGRIDQLLVDRDAERVAAVRLDSGRTVPIEPLVIREDSVVLLNKAEETESKSPPPGRRLSERPIRVRARTVRQPPRHMPRKPQRDWKTIGFGAAAAGAIAGAALLRRKAKKDDFQLRLQTDENIRLISSKKVEGTPVVSRDGDKLGEIDSFMVDKYTGRVAYAVMSLRGMLGMGSSLFPLPWPLLEYDVREDGYVLDVTKEQFADAPKFQPSEEPEFDADYRRRLILFYGR